MGFIATINPGSIRSTADMTRALEMVLDDIFDGVGHVSDREWSEGFLEFTLDDRSYACDAFRISIMDSEEACLRAEKARRIEAEAALPPADDKPPTNGKPARARKR